MLLMAFCFLAFELSQPRDEGKTAGELIRLAGLPKFMPELGLGTEEDFREALPRLRLLGSKAEEALIRELQARDGIWHGINEEVRRQLPLAALRAFPPVPNARYRRQTAVTIIGKMGTFSAKTERALVVACRDPDPIVRERAVLILGYRGSRSAEMLRAVTEAMRDSQLAMRVTVGGPALAGFDFKANTVGELIWDLGCPFPETRYQAASALRDLGSNAYPAVVALIGACAESNELVRVASVKALGSIGIGATNAVPTLRTMLDDKNSFVRAAATESIEQIQLPLWK